MAPRSPPCLLVCSIIIAFLIGFSPFAHSATDPNDVNALLALQTAWGAGSILGWHGNDPCQDAWEGIQCTSNYSGDQRIQSLILSNSELAGPLPPDIGSLTALQTLDLSFNNLTGPIPRQIGNLNAMTDLFLQGNALSQNLPPELGQLQSLVNLYLEDNSFTGSIPHELGYLQKLEWLDLASNNLGGSLPYSSDGAGKPGLDNLTNTRHFHLNNNGFVGSIPKAMCHPGMALAHLLLDGNQLSQAIPDEIGLCANLLILKLDHNRLQDPIPSNISQLTQLIQLQLGSNELSGGLPDLSALTQLQVLDLSNNPNFNEAAVPPWLLKMKTLTELNMEDTNLRGTIPKALFALPSLETVNLANNSIDGILDLRMASAQLLLVSVESNQIESVNEGQYAGDIQLAGNPACNSGSNNLSAADCIDTNPPASPAIYPQSAGSCSNTCSSGLTVNPAGCTCSVPFQGLLTYRAPSFTNTRNITRILLIIPTLARVLNINKNQIQLVSPRFDVQNELLVGILIFPVGFIRWTRDEISAMSAAIGGQGVSPDGFGPYSFQPEAYHFEDIADQSGLSTKAKIGIAVGGTILGLLVVAVGLFAILQKRRADQAMHLSKQFASWGGTGKDSDKGPQLKGSRWFSLAELKKATKNFSEENLIGSGGYGKVYKGVLVAGVEVAIKRAQQNSLQGATEFKTEIELLSRVHHKNVVSLIGFCREQGEQMLVYEYMANGTLRDNLSGKTNANLDWHRRLMIALGAARGITYLHELVNPPIIHRDIKSTNILLSEQKIAKVADFGLSKIGPEMNGTGKAHVSTQVKGTVGYLDPEYYLSQQLTDKSDVYSYGVVLLEMLTGRQPIEKKKYVVKEMKQALEEGGINAIRPLLDPKIQGEDLSELQKFVNIAMACVEECSGDRPTMGEVVKELENLVGIEYNDAPKHLNYQQLEQMRTDDYNLQQFEYPHDDFGSMDHHQFRSSSKNSFDPSFDYSVVYVSPPIVPK